MSRTCMDCPKELGRRNRSGRCRSCLAKRHNSDPATQAKIKAGLAAYFDRPGVRAAYTARINGYIATMPDAERARRVEHGRALAREVLHSDAVRAKTQSADARRRAGATRSNTVLGWCPKERRDEYRTLCRQMPAQEARRLVEDDLAAAERRRVAAMTPLERQMEKLANGAQLVTVHRRSRGDLRFTPGGVASGHL